MMRFCLVLGCFFGVLLAQQGSLDPTIFDGTDVELDMAEPAPSGSEENPSLEETPASETGLPEATEEEANQEPLDPTLPIPEGSPSGTPEPSETEEGQGEDPTIDENGEGPEESEEDPGSGQLEAEEERTGNEPGNGSTSPAEGSGRAEEEVETSTRVVPGQAVDIPWDL